VTAPPGGSTLTRVGVTASPTKSELIGFARLVVSNLEIPFSQNKIVRLVLRFQARLPNGDGRMFFLYLTNAMEMSEAQQGAALINEDIAQFVAHRDPVAIEAVHNVLRERGY
jgi:hypothetical protein